MKRHELNEIFSEIESVSFSFKCLIQDLKNSLENKKTFTNKAGDIWIKCAYMPLNINLAMRKLGKDLQKSTHQMGEAVTRVRQVEKKGDENGK